MLRSVARILCFRAISSQYKWRYTTPHRVKGKVLNQSATLTQNIATSVKRALGIATLLSLYVAGMAVLRGSPDWTSYHTSTWHIIAGYYVGSVAGGVVVGALWQFTTHRLGAGLVGVVGGTVVYAAIGIAIGYGTFAIASAPVLGTIVGGGLGLQVWEEANPERAAETPLGFWKLLAIALGAIGTLTVIYILVLR